ncbi:Npun_R2821/Npun_R2822 family protein [Nostoc edaphicum]|nr:Npun_R2821/Npun_R2822 family protein [Nostoc edaphicum]
MTMDNFGIYTLANDVVFDQLVALLNSIEVNVSADIPICIIPYDDRLERVKQEIHSRSNVTLFDDKSSIQKWDDFAVQVWNAYPINSRKNKPSMEWNKKNNLIRKMCAFDGEFEKFVFYDADSLAMNKLDKVLEKLDQYDFVFDDWEHTKQTSVAAFDLPKLEQKMSLSESEIRRKIHCSSFFGSKKGILGIEELKILKKRLIEDKEVEWINELAWWCDADLFSYMTFRIARSLFNFTLSPNGEDRTGNCARVNRFVNIDNVLYNQQGLKPIHRLHYMGYGAIEFARLCKGEDVNICYKNEFLHYRFLKQPEQKPKRLKPPTIAARSNRFIKKVWNKINQTISYT